MWTYKARAGERVRNKIVDPISGMTVPHRQDRDVQDLATGKVVTEYPMTLADAAAMRTACVADTVTQQFLGSFSSSAFFSDDKAHGAELDLISYKTGYSKRNGNPRASGLRKATGLSESAGLPKGEA